MIKRDIKVFGGGGKGQTPVASSATPSNIDEIGKPAVHLISGATGVGKSNVARNMVEAYYDAHAKARTKPAPDILVYTGASGDPVWEGGSKRVKMYGPQTASDFVDEVNRRYDRAIRAKTAPTADPSVEGSGVPKADEYEDDDKHKPTMVVVDDAGASELFPAQMFRSPIAQAIQSHRHSDMSFIISSQRYHSHNPWLRSNAATVNVFPPKGSEETNFLKRDLPIPQEALRRGFAVASANGKHNFISVDTRERVATHGFSGHAI